MLPSAASSAPVVEPAPPKDERSLISLASERASAGQDAEAVSLAAKALTQHPSWRDDARLAPVLFRGAASESKETSDLAFGLLQGTMAARGAEIVYQLAQDKGAHGGVAADSALCAPWPGAFKLPEASGKPRAEL